MTLEELVERLNDLDEVTVLELLNISTEELVATFKWKLEDIAPDVMQELEIKEIYVGNSDGFEP